MRDKVLQLPRKYNSLSAVKVGTIVLAVYSVALVIMMFFHEPWYDEAQAWMIAKAASYGDMFFVIPHVESHPPLWHLLLSIPAKLGLPYEVSLKAVNFVFALGTVYLIEFKSPFTNITKTVLPFTYFFFLSVWSYLQTIYDDVPGDAFLCSLS